MMMTDLENMARTAFDTAMCFGVSVDSFEPAQASLSAWHAGVGALRVTPFEKIHTFADAKAWLRQAITLKDIEALNEAVDERFLRDQQQLIMADKDWEQWTRLISQRVADIEREEHGAELWLIADHGFDGAEAAGATAEPWQKAAAEQENGNGR